jgi:hypothetical protein
MNGARAAVVCAGLFLWPAHMAAAQEDLSPPPLIEAEGRLSPPKASSFGLLVDVGVPDGLGLCGLWRPWAFATLSVGGLTTGGSGGIRGGLTLQPLGEWVRPGVTVEVGQVFAGNVTWVLSAFGARKLGGVLERAEYRFANAHLGVELGGRYVSRFVRAGLSHVDATVHAVNVSWAEQVQPTFGPISFRATHPSAKLGVLVLFP